MNQLYAVTCHYKINVHDLVSLLQFYVITFNNKKKQFNNYSAAFNSSSVGVKVGCNHVHSPISPQLKVTVGNTIDKYYCFKFYGLN